MSDGKTSSNKSLPGILLGIAAFTVAALGMLVFLNSRRTAPVAALLTTAEARALVHRKNVAFGQLENQKVSEGIEAFTEIAQKIPADPLGIRNLAVARILALGSEDQAAPIGVLFSGGVDSGALFLLVYHALLRRGESPTR